MPVKKVTAKAAPVAPAAIDSLAKKIVMGEVVKQGQPKKTIATKANHAIIDRLRRRSDVADVTLDQFERVFRAIFDELKAEVLEQKRVSIIGMGSFELLEVPEKVRAIPMLGCSVKVEAHNKVKFKQTGHMTL